MTLHPIPCPHCDASFQVEASHHGRRARCGRCDGTFVIRFDHVEAEEAGRSDAIRTRLREAECELAGLRSEIEGAARDLQAARDSAAEARAEATTARVEADRTNARGREGAVQLSEQAALLQMNRDRLEALEEHDRLEQLAAEDIETRIVAARSTLADGEQVRSRQLEALEALSRRQEATEHQHAELVVQCNLLRAQESELRECITELDASRSRLTGETIAAEPKAWAPSGQLLLPNDLDRPGENGRPANWLGGLRGLEMTSEHGSEFLERLAPLLDQHPDRRALDAWAHDGRTVFLLCKTPDEAGRLEELIDIWGEVDPDGVAALAPALHTTKSWIAAPSRAVTRGTVTRRRAAKGRSRTRRTRRGMRSVR
jgi:predicted Zn finger-like uncharacterized protein